MKKILKQFEAYGRRSRAHISPDARKLYKELKGRELSALNDKSPQCIALDLKSTILDADGGRYFYYLIKDILAAGYSPIIKTNYQCLATFAHKRYKKLALDLPIGFYDQLDQLPDPYSLHLVITDHAPEIPTSIKVATLKKEKRLPQEDYEIAIPYCSHPHTLAQDPNLKTLTSTHPREKNIFFAGGVSRPKYANPKLDQHYGKISRADGVDAVLHALEAGELDSDQFHIHSRSEDRIPPQAWLQTMGNSHFFLAFPGVNKPLSHNLIEALSVGTIPILQYSEYLHPALINGINCLTFTDKNDLIRVAKLASTMPLEEIISLSKGTLAYYEEYITLGTLSHILINHSSHHISLFAHADTIVRTPSK